jgi:hypothetical protein
MLNPWSCNGLRIRTAPIGSGAYSSLPIKKMYHKGIKQIPCVLRYGWPCHVGLSLMNLPPAFLGKLVTEEDIEEAMEHVKVMVAAPTTTGPATAASATTEPATATAAPSDTSTTANSDNTAVEAASILDPATSRAERRKTILEEWCITNRPLKQNI